MKYTYEIQKKALKYLIDNVPHNMDLFYELYNVEIEGTDRAEVGLYDILFSDVWTTEEKEELIELYGHNDKERHEYSHWNYKSYERDNGYSAGIEGLPLIDQCIKHKNYSGVEALLNLGEHISVATIMRIIEYITDPKERYKFCELIINHYKDKECIMAYKGNGNQCYLRKIPSLCDRYSDDGGYYDRDYWRTISSMENICETNDIELIKLFLPTIKNINPLFMFAVRSKNIEMVKLFIDAGADVNYQDLEFKDIDRKHLKTSLKIAIDNNDLEMIKFLHQNGANLDFVDKSEKMQEFTKKIEKEVHKYKENYDRQDYISLTKTPLEYAINSGAASIINPDIISNNSAIKNNSYEKQFKERIEIVKYLYENGATFGDGEINYTDLICFAIKSDDFETTKYFFEEALKNNNHLDFAKIISFIHTPGIVKTSYYSSVHYKIFEEGANPWFKMCEEYSKKIDNENYNKNIKLMLKKIFKDFTFNNYQFEKYREVITDFSKVLPSEDKKEIPAVFGVSLNNLEEVLDLGYDINCINTDGSSIFMNYINNSDINVEVIDKLISLGANPNYQSSDGKNALSCAIAKFPEYDFEKYIDIFNRETGKLYHAPDEYEKNKKIIVLKMIDLSNQDIIMSDSVKQAVYKKITPGYSQIIYNEILVALSKKGFKVGDDYFTKSIIALDKSYFSEYVTNQWEYLWNLYSNFSNKSIETNHKFPKIETAKDYKYGKEQSNNLFTLINEHLKRNFATSLEEVQEPDKIVNEGYYYDSINRKFEDRTSLQKNQDILLNEISRYIGYLDYHYIMALINNFSIIDINSITRNELLPKAINAGDEKLCRALIKKGITIICYDEIGHDVTSKKYSTEQIDFFLFLDKEYNPNQECENLLKEIGCEDIDFFKKLKK